MRILLLHPDDSLENGPCQQKWDQVIDLGKGGCDFYRRSTLQLGCPVVPLDSLRVGVEDFQWVREISESGRNRLLDAEGLDWWELTAIFFHQQIELLGVLRRFAENLKSSDELYITRPGFYADALRFLLRDRLQVLSSRIDSHHSALRYVRSAARFPIAQLAEILWDKYDSNYFLRRRFTGRRKPSRNPVVLLPSAYVNVSRMAIAYARTVPEMDFLLVATRRSGWLAEPSANVAVAKLASYAKYETSTRREYDDLSIQWRHVRTDLESVPEIGMLGRLGLLDSFPKLLRQGLAIREAWRQVFETEPVKAVLCADDSNPYTHIPVLLARNRGIPAIACHHGALDGAHLFKRSHADVILAKGKMEQDYLVRVCGVPNVNVEIGAPADWSPTCVRRDGDSAPFITFFSEPYEVASARTDEFYRDLLPRLADLALKAGRKLVVKLHPFEIRRYRQPEVSSNLWQPVTSARLQELFSGARKYHHAFAS